MPGPDAWGDAAGPTGPARHVRLGIDVGDARVGVARSDRDGMLATPVETVARDGAARRVAEIAVEVDAGSIVVGLPRSLNGSLGPAAQKALDFCAELDTELDAAGRRLPLRMMDERMTTVDAHQALRGSGRKTKKHRSVVDQVAAVMILQQGLDQMRSTGREPGSAWPLDA
jgi:putative holliday junction resolvase